VGELLSRCRPRGLDVFFHHIALAVAAVALTVAAVAVVAVVVAAALGFLAALVTAVGGQGVGVQRLAFVHQRDAGPFVQYFFRRRVVHDFSLGVQFHKFLAALKIPGFFHPFRASGRLPPDRDFLRYPKTFTVHGGLRTQIVRILKTLSIIGSMAVHRRPKFPNGRGTHGTWTGQKEKDKESGTVERWNGGTVERWKSGKVERWKSGGYGVHGEKGKR
jgi:hypothetical protein